MYFPPLNHPQQGFALFPEGSLKKQTHSTEPISSLAPPQGPALQHQLGARCKQGTGACARGLLRTRPHLGTCHPKGHHGKREGSLGPWSSAACRCPCSLCQPGPPAGTQPAVRRGPPLALQCTWGPSCLPSLSTGHLRRGLAAGCQRAWTMEPG